MISALGAVLLAAPLIRSQETQLPEANLIVTQPPAIQVLDLQPQRFVDGWVPMIPVFSPCHGRTGSFPLSEFSVWETLTGTLETGRAGFV